MFIDAGAGTSFGDADDTCRGAGAVDGAVALHPAIRAVQHNPSAVGRRIECEAAANRLFIVVKLRRSVVGTQVDGQRRLMLAVG
jgi:hypothetical protein